MQCVWELVYKGKTIGIYNTEEKAEKYLEFYFDNRLYANESRSEYVIRKTIIE